MFFFPLSLIDNLTETNNKRRLVLKEKVEEYKKEIGKLNNKYNMFFTYIKQVIEVISLNMKEIPNSVQEINNNLQKSTSEYQNLLGKFKEGNSTKEMHQNLLDIKKSFLDIKNTMNRIKIE